jgi:ligand-binding sensor domain-containing protein/signal transduction histidine kinase
MKALLTGLFTFLFVLSDLAQYPSYVSYNIENGAPSNEIYCLLQDKDGYIWIGSDAGVYRFNGVTYEHFSSQDLLARSATGLIQTSSGRIYGYNFKGQIFYIEKEQLHVIKDWDGPVNGLATDDQGKVWVSAQNGCYSINDKNQTLEKYHSNLLFYGKDSLAFANNIRRNEEGSIFFQNGNKLIKLSNSGKENLFELNLKYKSTTLIISNSKQSPWLFSYTESSVYHPKKGLWKRYEDRRFHELYNGRKVTAAIEIDNDLWICTHTGIIRMDLLSGNCELMFPTIAFSGILKDREGNYWFSTLHHGLLKTPSIDIRAWNRQGGILSVEQLSHVSISPNDLISAGTNGDLLKLTDKKNVDVIHHQPQADIGMLYYDQLDQCTYFNKLSFIYRHRNGKVELVNDYARAIKDMLHIPEGYFILSSQGLYFIKDISEDLVEENLISDGWFREIVRSPFGTGYFIAGNDGILKLEKVGGKWRLNKNFLPNKQVLSLTIDQADKKIYFLTFDGELHCISKNGNCELLRNDLGNLRPVHIRYHNGKLYLATIKGLLRIDVKSGEQSLLNTNNGLASNNIRYIAIEGNICWIASGKGLMRVPLSAFDKKRSFGKVIDRGVKIDSLFYSSEKIPVIQYDELLTIFVDGLSYSSNDNFFLAYRIPGYNNDWIKIPGSLGKIEIPRLPSGELTIEVKMIDHLGSDSLNILKYKVKVIPPFWQRWWFYVLIVLLVAGSAFLIFRSRLIKLRKKQQQALRELRLENELRLTQQNALKAQMNPHFLFNVLNSIKGYIYENDKKNAARYLSDFSSLVRKVLDLSSLPTVSLDQELDALKLYIDLEAMLLQSDFQYRIQVEENVDPSGIQIPALLLQPYVENAFKHGLRHKTGPKRILIRITMDEENGVLTIEISDNGIGRKAAGELNAVNRGEHESFATSAMEKRIELLNHGKKDLVGVEISDKFEGEEAVGTIVTIRIHV